MACDARSPVRRFARMGMRAGRHISRCRDLAWGSDKIIPIGSAKTEQERKVTNINSYRTKYYFIVTPHVSAFRPPPARRSRCVRYAMYIDVLYLLNRVRPSVTDRWCDVVCPCAYPPLKFWDK